MPRLSELPVAFKEVKPKPRVELSEVGAFGNLAVTPTFSEIASLEVARWVLGLFVFVYVLCFVYSFMLFFVPGGSFDSLFEVMKYLIQSILPLATLAVGFYLGDKTKKSSAPPTS